MLKKNVVITIDRLYGSGGRIMGQRLSEELGIPYYNEEILKDGIGGKRCWRAVVPSQ